MRCTAVVKYASKARPLMVCVPVPGRRRARATASLRRPVVWVSGLVAMNGFLSRSAGLRRGEIEDDWELGCVSVLGTGVDLELLDHLAPEWALRQHALDAATDCLFRS